MKTIAVSAALAIAILASESQAAFKLKLAKTHHPTTLSKRHILPRQNVNLELFNNVTGGSYAATVSVGTPAQEQNLAIDTGSSDVWFLDSSADLCTDPYLVEYFGGCSSSFDSGRSKSIEMAVEGAFNISYLDGSGAAGDYIFDDIIIGDETVKGQMLGLAYDVTVTTGIMGIGYTQNVASNSGRLRRPFTYPTMVDQMFDQGLIKLKAYSLYLDSKDSEKGSIIFGGLDSDKYVGNLFQLPVVPTELSDGSQVYDHFAVVMTSLHMSNGTTNTSFTSPRFRQPVILDSGTTLTYLPEVTVRQIYTELGAVDDIEGKYASGLVYVDCAIGSDDSVSFNYEFGDSRETVEIRVPVSELLYSLTDIFGGRDYSSYIPNLPFEDACAFGIMPAISGISLLGDTFLRSAYVVYDLTNNLIAMAQGNPGSENENIVDFKANATEIPRVSGVASIVEATQTLIFIGGGGGGRPRPNGTNTATGDVDVVTVTASASPDSGVGGRAALDMSALLVLGVSFSMAVLGGGWFLT